jgi:hypothetical protein
MTHFNTEFIEQQLAEHGRLRQRIAEELEREIRDEVLRDAARIEAPFVCDAPPLRIKLCRGNRQAQARPPANLGEERRSRRTVTEQD